MSPDEEITCGHCNEKIKLGNFCVHVAEFINFNKFKCRSCKFETSSRDLKDYHERKNPGHSLESVDQPFYQELLPKLEDLFVEISKKLEGSGSNQTISKPGYDKQQKIRVKEKASKSSMEITLENYLKGFKEAAKKIEYNKLSKNREGVILVNGSPIKLISPINDENGDVICSLCGERISAAYIDRRKHIVDCHKKEFFEKVAKNKGSSDVEWRLILFEMIKNAFPSNFIFTDLQCLTCGKVIRTMDGKRSHLYRKHDVQLTCLYKDCKFKDFESSKLTQHLKENHKKYSFSGQKGDSKCDKEKLLKKLSQQRKYDIDMIMTHYFPVGFTEYTPEVPGNKYDEWERFLKSIEVLPPYFRNDFGGVINVNKDSSSNEGIEDRQSRSVSRNNNGSSKRCKRNEIISSRRSSLSDSEDGTNTSIRSISVTRKDGGDNQNKPSSSGLNMKHQNQTSINRSSENRDRSGITPKLCTNYQNTDNNIQSNEQQAKIVKSNSTIVNPSKCMFLANSMRKRKSSTSPSNEIQSPINSKRKISGYDPSVDAISLNNKVKIDRYKQPNKTSINVTSTSRSIDKEKNNSFSLKCCNNQKNLLVGEIKSNKTKLEADESVNKINENLNKFYNDKKNSLNNLDLKKISIPNSKITPTPNLIPNNLSPKDPRSRNYANNNFESSSSSNVEIKVKRLSINIPI
uniref:C2H2-type domain-containing protein n=1 Tax=Parastrongyloides trichosuri TaxID=131310 RepID=A0A0N4Z0L5_PARTI